MWGRTQFQQPVFSFPTLYVATLLYVGCYAGQSGSNLLTHIYDPLEMCLVLKYLWYCENKINVSFSWKKIYLSSHGTLCPSVMTDIWQKKEDKKFLYTMSIKDSYQTTLTQQFNKAFSFIKYYQFYSRKKKSPNG